MRALFLLAAAGLLAAAEPPRIRIIENLQGPLVFPPTGRAYKDNAESHRLWRSLALEAPDLVLIVGEDFGLAEALSKNVVAGVGRIPARRIEKRPAKLPDAPPSEAHTEMDRRLARSPQQVAAELAVVFGHELPTAVYIPAMALVAQLQLGNLSEVQRLAEPFVDGSKDSLAKATGSHLAGHLLFADLAERTGDARYTALVKKAAALAATETLHNSMSDAVFMGCPILAAAGDYKGSLDHLRLMQKICLRPDGLYRHSPLNETAWGRGNAFPALGLAFALSNIAVADAAFQPMLEDFRNHIKTLAKFQDSTGMWHEVIDRPDSFAEFTATAMIGTAMLRGVKNGWLDGREYRPRIEKAWRAILARTGKDGTLIDVCESTGKMKSLEDYLSRHAILGPDPRGGAMALLFATEPR